VLQGLEDETEPEMSQTNLERYILTCKRFDGSAPSGLLEDALYRPAMSEIERAVSKLKEV